jgi:C-terminal processing protease CtpA/Prc
VQLVPSPSPPGDSTSEICIRQSAPDVADSQGFALSDPQPIAEGLPRYRGPKVLITEALCYSAADIFAAGIQDNNLGLVLGTAGHTGAGGANVGTYELLRLWLDDWA